MAWQVHTQRVRFLQPATFPYLYALSLPDEDHVSTLVTRI